MSFYLKRYELLFLLLLLLVSFTVRIWPIQMVHWWDETVYLQNADVLFGFKADNYNEFEFRPPLLSFLIGLTFLAWHSVIISSILVALIGTIGVLFIYLLARELFGKKEAFISSLFFALIPFLVSNSRMVLTDVPSLTFLVIGSFLFVKYTKDNYPLILGIFSGLFFSFALLMRYSTIPTLICLLIAFLFVYNTKAKLNFKKVYPILLGFVVPLVIFFAWMLGKYGNPISIFTKALSLISEVNHPFEFYIISLPFAFTWFVIFGFLVAIIYLVLNFKKEDSRKELFLLLSFFLIMLILMASSHKEERYLVEPLSISVILLSSRGFVQLFEFCKKNFKSVLVFGGLFVFCTFIFFLPSFGRIPEPFINNAIITDEYVVSTYLEGLNDSNIIYTNNYWPVFGYYTTKKIVLLNGANYFYEGYPKNMPENGFFIVHKGDNLFPSKEWLSKNSSFKFFKNFNNFEVYYYTSNN